jgi:hypothetical protein
LRSGNLLGEQARKQIGWTTRCKRHYNPEGFSGHSLSQRLLT